MRIWTGVEEVIRAAESVDRAQSEQGWTGGLCQVIDQGGVVLSPSLIRPKAELAKNSTLEIEPVAALAVAATVLSVLKSPGSRTWVSVAAAAIAAVAVLLGGFQIAWSHIVCQPTGQSGGSSAGLFGGSAYDCNDGVLSYH